MVKAFTRDGVAINELAIKRLVGGEIDDPNRAGYVMRIVGKYPHALNIKCFSHTIDLCGGQYQEGGLTKSRIEGEYMDWFYKHVNGLFTTSSETPNNLWWATFDTRPKEVNSGTRWWIKEEWMAYYLAHTFPEPDENRPLTLVDWVKGRYESGAVTTVHMTELYNVLVPEGNAYDPARLGRIQMDLAIVVDITKVLRELTYTLEGDGPLALITHRAIERARSDLLEHWIPMDYPNVKRVIDANVAAGITPPDDFVLQQGETQEALWRRYCRTVSKPCVDYFDTKVYAHPARQIFICTALANPYEMYCHPVGTEGLRDRLAPLVGKLLDQNLVDRMVGELSAYKEACSNPAVRNWDSLSDAEQLKEFVSFWCTRRLLPAWKEFAHLCFLVQPSSACVERAFSILKYIYGEQQTTAKQDLIETTLMLRYNRDH